MGYDYDEVSVKEASRIESVIMDFRGATEEQSKAICVLRERLRPVLSPQDTAEALSEAPRVSSSPLYDEVVELLRTVQRSTRQVHEIIQELDV